MELIVAALAMVGVSTLIIVRACDGFEVAADYLGRHLSEGVKGASLNAVGSSMPELLTTTVFLFFFGDTSGFAGGIGTTAGSAVFNSMVIPTGSILAALAVFRISRIEVARKVIWRDGLSLIVAEFVLILTIGTRLDWWHGLLLLGIYLIYAVYTFGSMKRRSECETEEDERTDGKGEFHSPRKRLHALLLLDLQTAVIGGNEQRTGNSWLLLAFSTAALAVACYILVLGCETIGQGLGIHGYFVAVILAAAASSVPDTILSIKDARKGNYDDAVSNALGSNIFDICVALGLPLLVYTLIHGPIEMEAAIVDDVSELRILLLILTIAVFALFLFGRGMGRLKAWAMLMLYALFTAFVLGRAYEWRPVTLIADGLHRIQQLLQ